jgi:hypothetical protein
VGELPRGRSVAGRRGHFLRLEIDCGVAEPSDCRNLDKLRADEPDRVGSGRKQAQAPARAVPTRGEQGRRPQGKGCIPDNRSAEGAERTISKATVQREWEALRDRRVCQTKQRRRGGIKERRHQGARTSGEVRCGPCDAVSYTRAA